MGEPFKYELTDLSATHNAIADWLICNPGKGQLGRCAAHFGYTRSWLSTLIHTDAFKAMMKAKQGKAFDENVVTLADKIAGVAHASVEKLGEIVESTNDERLVREIGRDMLSNLGYGASTKAPGVVINNNTQNNLTVNSDALAAARNRQSQHYGRTIEGPSESEASADETSPAQLPSDQGTAVGPPSELRADSPDSAPALPRLEAEGSEV